MGNFNFMKCDIEGLYIVEPKLFTDARGYFMETYHYEDFKAAGLNMTFVQDNQSASVKGVLRGLHYQKQHPQGKLVRVLSGTVYDVAVDIRKNSPTYGKYYGVILSAENKKMFYVPTGFAHGFLVLSDKAEFTYKCTDFYHPEDEGGIRWDDEEIGIPWPLEAGMQPILSEKDSNRQSLSEIGFSYDLS
ncbi:MAG: dTDP-4-dehydrorhamnose 3,5-epimerase [Mobilitalea sp.]